ncbi:MAG: metallophosphoesterase [Lachnospiraceae bacterium]|nr:metallophosphoesterase [Lachnospiraceae bacterium]
MSLYAIGDLHLHFGSELKAGSQLTERIWKDHEKKFADNCRKTVKPEDTLILVGDHSWGKNMEECAPDLCFIEELPGRKILVRGNHDMFWDAKKTDKLNEMFKGSLEFLQGNYFAYEDFALVGTKGFAFEGPFYLNRFGKIVDWDDEKAAHAEKIVEREAGRLRQSFKAAKNAGYTKYIMFLHYPPTNILQTSSVFTDMAEEYGAEQVIYAHTHGSSRFHDSIEGKLNGVEYTLVSGDYRKWKPYKVI